jgi:hypothetical protein
MTAYAELNNLVLIFPLIVLAVIAYFHHAMSEVGAKLEPEQLLQKPLIIASTLTTAVVAVLLLHWGKTGTFNVIEHFHFFQGTWK